MTIQFHEAFSGKTVYLLMGHLV